jgi:UDP-N-acetylglucosamine 1-carboxyvinyltransferase
MQISIEGGRPLLGNVTVSGAKNSALKLIPAALFSNENVVIDNVPKIEVVLRDIEIIKSIGGSVEWAGNNRVVVNGSGINTYEIPYELGCTERTSVLLAGPLLFRFGKAYIPKYSPEYYTAGPINRFMDTWKSLGLKVSEDSKYLKITAESPTAGSVKFKTASHMATDNAILCSIFINGETTINNASEETEIEDLIELLNKMGAEITIPEPKIICVKGKNIYKSAVQEVQPDRSEAATFAAAAIVTRGNVEITGIKKETFIPFANFLSKIGARYDFGEKSIRVWRNEEDLIPTQVVISPTPGFIPDWQSLAVLMLTQAQGESYVNDTVYVNRYGYVTDLNRMGAHIELVKPSLVNMLPVVSDDTYDFATQGEPTTVAKILGPKKLKAERLQVVDFRYGAVLPLAALSTEGKSEIIGMERIEAYYENFTNKLESLGAKIWRP